ncbi:MAG: M1 family metallopeptidase [Gemmatimonadetes bacterium]|nr:M1 family metallopeptidase [Gemmatimonadota bacterium]
MTRQGMVYLKTTAAVRFIAFSVCLSAGVLASAASAFAPADLAAWQDRGSGQQPDSVELARLDSLRRTFDPAQAFAPLELPPPSGTRAADGSPGESYWQQRADYRIDAELRGRTIVGSETITYTNNSPDSLVSLWVQLDQNLFAHDSRGAQRARELDVEPRHGGFFKGGGFRLSKVMLEREGEPRVPEYRVDDTMLEILLDKPLLPGGAQLEIEIDFEFQIPRNGGDRMGQLRVDGGTIFQVAQWYPRMFTYDDVNGWNESWFLGQGEWYLEYGDFDVQLTVPRKFLVAATGELMNPREVLTPDQQARLADARRSEVPVFIVEPDEVGRRESRPEGEGPLTWRFRAENVRDFAWATSDRFVWDAAGWEDVLAMSFYPAESMGGQFAARRFGDGFANPGSARGLGAEFGTSGWERSTDYLLHSIRHYSRKWHPYPYPVAINVAGLALGMEYPMIVFCSWESRGAFLFAVTDHEIGHTWFPMMVGSDERRYPWMDEGFNTFINYYSGIEYSGGSPVLSEFFSPPRIAMEDRQPGLPILSHADTIPEADIGHLAYGKPAAVLILLREQILGPEVFDEGLREYINRWAWRHPQPADFIRTMEDVSGQDLDWFFKGWIFEDAVLDQAVAAVSVDDGVPVVAVENRGGIPMPVRLRVVFADGTEQVHDVPVSEWQHGNRYVVRLETGKRVRNVQLDPDGVLPDVDRSNNIWGRGIIRRTPRGS